MKKKLFFFILIFIAGFLHSQEKRTKKEIDSITNVLWNSKSYNNEGLARLTELYYQAKEIDYPEGEVRLLVKIADIKAGKLDYVGALEALKILKPLSLSIGAYEHYISGCGVEAKIYFQDHNYSQAKKVLHQAEQYLPKIKYKEKRRKAKIEIYIFQWYNFDKSKIPQSSYTDSLLSISKKFYQEAILIENDYHRANRVLFSSNLVTNSLVLLKRYEEAVKYVKIAGQQIKIVGEDTYIGADYYEAKGDVEYHYKKSKNYSIDSALANYNKAIKIGEKILYKARTKGLYAKVAKIYEEKKDQNLQIQFLGKARDLEDSIETEQNKALDEVKPTLYTVNSIEKKEEQYSHIKTILFSLLALLVTTLVGIGTKKFYRKKNSINKVSISEISSKESAKLNSNSINHLTNLALNNDPSFYLTFLEVYPDFGKKLLKINPMIKISDIEFCAYIKLNLETKQIATLKKMSVRAVEGKKYRIRKKLDISVDENMYIWLSDL